MRSEATPAEQSDSVEDAWAVAWALAIRLCPARGDIQASNTPADESEEPWASAEEIARIEKAAQLCEASGELEAAKTLRQMVDGWRAENPGAVIPTEALTKDKLERCNRVAEKYWPRFVQYFERMPTNSQSAPRIRKTPVSGRPRGRRGAGSRATRGSPRKAEDPPPEHDVVRGAA